MTKPRSTPSTSTARSKPAAPASGKGRREDVRGSGIYPASGPTPPKATTVKTPASLGRLDRGAADAVDAAEMPGDIPRADWNNHLNDFSSAHEGWATELQVFQPDQTAHIQAHGLPLEGLTLEGRPPGGIVTIVIGDEAAHHLTHTVNQVARITAIAQDSLEIDAADLGRVVLRCRQPG